MVICWRFSPDGVLIGPLINTAINALSVTSFAYLQILEVGHYSGL